MNNFFFPLTCTLTRCYGISYTRFELRQQQYPSTYCFGKRFDLFKIELLNYGKRSKVINTDTQQQSSSVPFLENHDEDFFNTEIQVRQKHSSKPVSYYPNPFTPNLIFPSYDGNTDNEISNNREENDKSVLSHKNKKVIDEDQTRINYYPRYSLCFGISDITSIDNRCRGFGLELAFEDDEKDEYHNSVDDVVQRQNKHDLKPHFFQEQCPATMEDDNYSSNKNCNPTTDEKKFLDKQTLDESTDDDANHKLWNGIYLARTGSMILESVLSQPRSFCYITSQRVTSIVKRSIKVMRKTSQLLLQRFYSSHSNNSSKPQSSSSS